MPSVVVYVDDLVFVGTSNRIILKQLNEGKSLSQGPYSAKILEKARMTGCNPCYHY